MLTTLHCYLRKLIDISILYGETWHIKFNSLNTQLYYCHVSFFSFLVFIVYIALIVCVQHVFLCCLYCVINDD